MNPLVPARARARLGEALVGLPPREEVLHPSEASPQTDEHGLKMPLELGAPAPSPAAAAGGQKNAPRSGDLARGANLTQL